MRARALLLWLTSCGGAEPSVAPTASTPVQVRVLPNPRPPAVATPPIAFEIIENATPREPQGRYPLWDELASFAARPEPGAPAMAMVIPSSFQVELQPGGPRTTESFSIARTQELRLSFLDVVPREMTFGGRECLPRSPALYRCGLEDEVQIVRVVLDPVDHYRTRGNIVARVDRTPECPLDASAAARMFIERGHQALAASLDAKLAAMIQVAQTREPAQGDDSRRITTRFAATADPNSRALRMIFYVRRVDERTRSVVQTIPGGFGCEAPPGADCAPREQPPRQVTLRIGKGWIAEIAIEQGIGCDGRVLFERERVSARAPVAVPIRAQEPQY